LTPKRAPVPPASQTECFAFAAASQLAPPRDKRTIRVEPVGNLVAQFVLPLAWCPPTNQRDGMSPLRLATIKKHVLARMLTQHHGCRRSGPLPGRPMVQVVRFSSAPGDIIDTGLSKIPVDRLTTKAPLTAAKKGQRRRPMPEKRGLGFLADDDSTHVDLRIWWEPAPPGKGFVWVRVFEGEKESE
jgi:hypothetical protein